MSSYAIAKPRLTVQRSQTFWLDDGNVVLLAEKIMFKVHRVVLARHSSFFKDIFLLDPGHLSLQKGTEQSPLSVPDVTPSALEYIFSLIYDRRFPKRSRNDTVEMVSVLRAAHKLEFTGILTVVARCIEKRLQPNTRLSLALECNIAEWKVPTFVEVVLSFCEPDRSLPLDILLLVQRARTIVSQRRLVYITRRAHLQRKDTASHGVERPSAEELLVVASTLAFAPRSGFDETYAAVAGLFEEDAATAGSSRRCRVPWMPKKGELESWVPEEEDEMKIVEDVWFGRDTSRAVLS